MRKFLLALLVVSCFVVVGCDGDQGEMGITGDTGVMGLTGPSGIDGLLGEPGVDGLAGAAGLDGEDGSDGNVDFLAPSLQFVVLYMSATDVKAAWSIDDAQLAVIRATDFSDIRGDNAVAPLDASNIGFRCPLTFVDDATGAPISVTATCT